MYCLYTVKLILINVTNIDLSSLISLPFSHIIYNRYFSVHRVADVSNAKCRRHEEEMTSSASLLSSGVPGNESSSSDDDDAERLSLASSTYLVTSGPEEDPTSTGTGCQQAQLRDGGRVEDAAVANHRHDNDGADRRQSGSLMGVASVTSCTGSGSRTGLVGSSVSGGAELSLCRATTLSTTSEVGEAGVGGGSDLELLCRLFPHVPPISLDCVLLSCAGNVVQCIEQLLRCYQLKPNVDTLASLPVGANFAAAAAAAAAAYAGLPHLTSPYQPHHRFVASSAVEPPLAFPVPAVGSGAGSNSTGGKPSLSLMPVAPFNGADAMRQLYVPGGPRALPYGFQYPPGALLPTIAGLRYNYSAMMAAAAMAHASTTSTAASGTAVAKATPSGTGGVAPLPYGLGLFAGAYKYTGPSSDSDK